MAKKEDKIIQETLKALLEQLQIDGDFSYTKSEDTIEVVLTTSDSGMVIGYHGEVLEALQLIFSLVLSKKLDNFVRVSIEVGDYKKQRTLWLENLVAQAKEKTLQEGREVAFTHLKSWERRIVHMLLQDDNEVMSESVGEGKERTLIIKPRG